MIYEGSKINPNIPTTPYLNSMLIGLDNNNAGFLATGIFAGILIYLQFCAIKGNLKIGLRIPYIFSLHPMKCFFNLDLMKLLWIVFCSMCYYF